MTSVSRYTPVQQTEMFCLIPPTQKASIDGMVSHLNSTPLDPDADVIIGVPAVYLDYVQGRLPKGFSMAAQV